MTNILYILCFAAYGYHIYLFSSYLYFFIIYLKVSLSATKILPVSFLTNSNATSFNNLINLYPIPDFTLVLNCVNISSSVAATISSGNEYLEKIVIKDLLAQLAYAFLCPGNTLITSLSNLLIDFVFLNNHSLILIMPLLY